MWCAVFWREIKEREENEVWCVLEGNKRNDIFVLIGNMFFLFE